MEWRCRGLFRVDRVDRVDYLDRLDRMNLMAVKIQVSLVAPFKLLLMYSKC